MKCLYVVLNGESSCVQLFYLYLSDVNSTIFVAILTIGDVLGGSLSRAILEGKISKKCGVCALAGSLYNIVNHLFKGTTHDVL